MVALARNPFETEADRRDRRIFDSEVDHRDDFPRGPRLALVRDEECDNRRIFGRTCNSMSVQALRLDHSISARRQPRLVLEVRDISLGGMSALSDQPVEFGERVRITFPPQKRMPWWDAFGRIIRCEPSALGYRVAVEFDPLPAA